MDGEPLTMCIGHLTLSQMMKNMLPSWFGKVSREYVVKNIIMKYANPKSVVQRKYCIYWQTNKIDWKSQLR